MLLNIFLKVALTIFEKEIKIICRLFDIEELYNIGMLQALQRFVFLLYSIDEIIEAGLQHLFYILLLNEFASIRLIEVFILICLVGSCKASSTQAFIHFDEIIPYLLVLLLHILYYKHEFISNHFHTANKEIQYSIDCMISQKLIIIMNYQQKIFVKRTFKAQRQYLIPLGAERYKERNVETYKPTQKYRKSRNNIERTPMGEQNQQQKIANSQSQRPNQSNLNHPSRHLPKIVSKRSLSVNIAQRVRIQDIDKSLPQKREIAKISTQPLQEGPWQDLNAQLNPIIIYEPLLGRKHVNFPTPIRHQSEIIQVDHSREYKEQSSLMSYKHPLYQKRIKKQLKEGMGQLYIGKIRNQAFEVARLKTKAQNLAKNKKKLIKVFNCVLFITYLRRYSKLYRSIRQKNMFELTIEALKKQITNFRECLWIQLNDFTSLIYEKRLVNFMITQKDSSTLIQKKKNYMNTFLESLICCIEVVCKQLQGKNMMKIMYHLCKHGCYSCGQTLLTKEELDILSLSENEGYIRCNQQLEKSSIISLFFIKIIIYCTLLKPHTITSQLNLTKIDYFESNLKLVGNILYFLIRKIQLSIIEKSKMYIGNWKKLKEKFIIKSTKSMTVKEGIQQKELISGLIKQKILIQYFQNPQWNQLSIRLQQIIDHLHNYICEFHKYIRKQCF